MRQGPTEAAVTSVVDMASHLATSDPSERERWVKNIRYAITQLAARQFAYGAQTNNFKVPQVQPKHELSADDARLLMEVVERAIKADCLPNYRQAFVLEQQLLASHAKEPIKWGRLRYAHIDDFAVDIKAIMAEPQQPIKNSVAFYEPGSNGMSDALREPVKHVAPEPVAPTVQRCPFTGAPLTPPQPAVATPKPFVF